MYIPKQLNIKETLHSVRYTVLATVIVATQLVACGGGGGGGGGNLTSSGTTGSSASLSSSVANDKPAASAPSPETYSSSAAPVPATGSFNISWTAPVARSDGTPLSLADIDGFRIYYGASRGKYPSSINVKDGSAQSAVVKNIPVGSYYVVMTTYDVNGLESSYSPAISKKAF